jgi:hypothetical protein
VPLHALHTNLPCCAQLTPLVRGEAVAPGAATGTGTANAATTTANAAHSDVRVVLWVHVQLLLLLRLLVVSRIYLVVVLLPLVGV